MIINDATWEFIRSHLHADVRKLALQGTKNAAVDLPMALQQIAGRQTAQKKLPSWAAIEGVVFPPHLNMEQCSSELTARYKAEVVRELCDHGVYLDLTGGFGVDFYWMSQPFQQRVYVEQNEALCAVAEHNFNILGHACRVVSGTAAEVLKQTTRADAVFLDPARRDEHGARTYGIGDCTPNVLELLPSLMEKSHCVLLKLSPMLDWRKAVSDLHHVSEVHIVSVDNECKELLVVMSSDAELQRVVCVNLSADKEASLFAFHYPTVEAPDASLPIRSANLSPFHYLYVPNASIMKAGCFSELATRYAVCQLSSNSHLFVSADEVAVFPGRRFRIQAVTSMNKHELREQLAGIRQANISVRNFPLTAEALRKKLKLKDGGDTYIFATTDHNQQHKLFICCKIG